MDGALAGTVTEVESEGTGTALAVDALTEVGARWMIDAVTLGKRRSGSLQAASHPKAARVARVFTDALITEVKVPVADGSDKDDDDRRNEPAHRRVIVHLDARLALDKSPIDTANVIVPQRGTGLPVTTFVCETPCNAVGVRSLVLQPGSLTARVDFVAPSVPWKPSRGHADGGTPEFTSANPKGLSVDLMFDSFEGKPTPLRGSGFRPAGAERLRIVEDGDGGVHPVIEARVVGALTASPNEPNDKPGR